MTTSAFATLAGAACFVTAVAWAGAMDLAIMKIRNVLVAILLVAYAVLVPFTGLDPLKIGLSVLVALGVLASMIVFFSRGWVGGGDAKLAAVVTLWVGADHALSFALLTALFGGLLTIGILLLRTMPLPASCLSLPWFARLHAAENGIPYGVAIAAAALFVFPQTIWTVPLI